MDEYLDLVDQNNDLTGERKLKSRIHRDGDWHRASQMWICNDSKETLFQLRSPEKDTFPGLWDITGGHVASGETYDEAAIRELKEELGLSVTLDELEKLFIHQDEVFREFQQVYLHRYNLPVSTLKLQAEEVSEARFIRIDTLRLWLTDPLERTRFCPVYAYYLKVLDILDTRG
jgi:isopentenyldiphosphate isomerase